MKDETVYLKHIRDAIAKIESSTPEGRKRFFADSMVPDAIIRNLEIIGEAARNLSPDFIRQRSPEIPWRSIIALQNVLIHVYFRVDLELVWRIVRRRLPTLKRHIEALLAEGRKRRATILAVPPIVS